MTVAPSGTLPRGPVQGWASARGVTVTASKQKGKLTITVAPDAVPGTCWVRLYDDKGATALRPFVVGTLPEVLEQEPNDDPGKPQVLPAAHVVVNGRLSKRGDVDGFAVELRKGQTLVASMEANRTLGSPLDAVLQVVSEQGFVLAENNDERGLDPQLAFTVPADGRYVVRTFGFPATPTSAVQLAGGETLLYRLTLTASGFADHAFPLAVARSKPGPVELIGWNIPPTARRVAVHPGLGDEAIAFHADVAGAVPIRLEPHPALVEAVPNDAKHPQDVTIPVTVSGRIDAPGNVDVYRFRAKKGLPFFFQVESRALGFALDPVLRLTDAAGKTLARLDDSRKQADPELAFTAPRDGTYLIEVSDLYGAGGSRYAYRLRALGPDYELTLKDDRFVLTPGKPLDVSVSVVRRAGFTGAVEVRAEGLPAGVTAAPARSGAGKAASVTLRLTATRPVAGAFRIVGSVPGQEGMTRVATASIAGLNIATPHLWLTATKQK